MEVIDTALMLGFLLLLGERITRIVMEKKASRRNGATGVGNPHGLTVPLQNLATLSQTVVTITERTEQMVEKNRAENTASHATLHTRIDDLTKDVVGLQVLTGRLEERVGK